LPDARFTIQRKNMKKLASIACILAVIATLSLAAAVDARIRLAKAEAEVVEARTWNDVVAAEIELMMDKAVQDLH
jgi:hypothetical protein